MKGKCASDVECMSIGLKYDVKETIEPSRGGQRGGKIRKKGKLESRRIR